MNRHNKAFLVFLLLLLGCKGGSLVPRSGVTFKPVAARQITMHPPQVVLMDTEARAGAAQVLAHYLSRSNYVINGEYVPSTYSTWCRLLPDRLQCALNVKHLASSRTTWCKAPPNGTNGEWFRDGAVDVKRLRSLRTRSECLALLGEPEIRMGPIGGVGVLWQWRFYDGKNRPASATEVNVGVVPKANKVVFVIVRVGDATPL